MCKQIVAYKPKNAQEEVIKTINTINTILREHGGSPETKAKLIDDLPSFPDFSLKAFELTIHPLALFNERGIVNIIYDYAHEEISPSAWRTTDIALMPVVSSAIKLGYNNAITILANAHVVVHKIRSVLGDPYEWTILSCFIQEKNIDVVGALIQRGADVSAKNDSYFTTPLLKAIESNSIPIMILLIENNATINYSHAMQLSMLSCAAPLQKAIYYNNPKAVQILIDNRADLTTSNIYGKTPLLYEAHYGCKDTQEVQQILTSAIAKQQAAESAPVAIALAEISEPVYPDEQQLPMIAEVNISE